MRLPPVAAAFAGIAFALCASVALAQDTAVPFDMSGERGPTADKTPAGEETTPVSRETKQPEKKAATPDLFD